MIYLKPVGGLCNRMRAIESTINLCEKNNCNLTIFWVKDTDLNCSFKSLFLPIKNTKVNIKVKEFKGNFINHYLNKIKLLKSQKFSFIKFLIYHFKKYRHNVNLDLEIAMLLWKIKGENLVLDKELRIIYNKTELITHNIEKLDNIFIENTTKLLKRLIESNNKVFIESCYRISSLSDITIFRPSIKLNKIIIKVTENFDNTIGIHIRRSDHKEATKRSKTTFFIDKMNEYISNDINVRFF